MPSWRCRRPSRSTSAGCCTAWSRCSATGSDGDTRRIVLEIAEVPHNPAAFVVQGHEARLGRVITNLLDNALSFSPRTASSRSAPAASGRRSRSSSRTTGPGMPADKLEDIFNRFYSDRPQTDGTVGKNSGLGLSISREIVNAYGGRIWASNRKLPARRLRSGRTTMPRSRTGAGPGWPAPASPSGCRQPMPQHPRERSRLPDAPELVHGTCVALGPHGRPAAGALGLRQVRSRPALSVPGHGAARPPWRPRSWSPTTRCARPQRRAPAGQGARRPSAARWRCAASASSTSSPWMEAELALVVDLVPAGEIERLPEGDATARLLGIDIPWLRLFPWEASPPSSWPSRWPARNSS